MIKLILLTLFGLAKLTHSSLIPFMKSNFNSQFEIYSDELSFNKKPELKPSTSEPKPSFPSLGKSKYPSHYFSQSLDHIDSKTFDQRYYVNFNHYKPGGPVFVVIGGESVLSSKGVEGLAQHLAKQHNGIVYALEHRFYGLSHPFDQLNSTTLRYLSSEYGLKDLANFITKVINPVTNTTNSEAKKYVIGGSYAGAMAAWMRQAYPELIDGAIASSAPVLAKEEFFEYDLSIGSTLGQKCLDSVTEITTYIDDLYSKKDPKFYEFKNRLGCQKVEDDKLFLYTISDTLALLVQYNSPSETPNIESFCQGFPSRVTIEAKISHYFDTLKEVQSMLGLDCLGASYQNELYESKMSKQNTMKQWTYQCCTEFGFWQVSPKFNQSTQLSTRSKYLTNDFFNEFFCSSKIFGTRVGPTNASNINRQRGGLAIEADRIIFTNGEQDPWSKLSRVDVENSRPNRPILIIKNGSHVNDLDTPGPKNSPSAQQVQNIIIDTIEKWVNRRY